jgi:RNA polymerase sigma factor (sigma-70 family)
MVSALTTAGSGLTGEFATLLETLVRSAKDGTLPMADVTTAVEELDARRTSTGIRRPRDIAPLLEALSLSGIDVTDDFTQADLEQSLAKLDRIQQEGATDLDSWSQWRHDATRHTILSAQQESELAHRYRFFLRSAEALGDSDQRLVDRLAEAAGRRASQAEIVSLLADEPDLATLAIGPAEKLKAIDAEIAEIEAQRASNANDQRAAREEARRVEAEFMSHNYKLVVHRAIRLHDMSRRRTDLMDLVQQGNLGMLEAWRRFDPNRGFKFSTFATWHIRQKISEFTLERAGAIKVPVHRHKHIRTIRQFEYEFMEEHGHKPTIAQIAAGLGKTEKKIVDNLQAAMAASPASLDKPINEEDGAATLGDMVEDSHALNPELAAEHKAMKEAIAEAMFDLKARERRVIQLRQGLYDGAAAKTLEQIGERMGITRERVRQIEQRALWKMARHPAIIAIGGDRLRASTLTSDGPGPRRERARADQPLPTIMPPKRTPHAIAARAGMSDGGAPEGVTASDAVNTERIEAA